MSRLRVALDDAEIAHRTGLLAEPPPRVVFSVADADVAHARAVVQRTLGAEGLQDELQPTAEQARQALAGAGRGFPWREVRPLASLVALHLVLTLWSRGPIPPGRAILDAGALAAGGTALQPWRLVTSLVLHVDPLHVMWNGLALLVFGVPLISWHGLRRVAWIYFAAGIGGGLTALSVAEAGTRIVGSSGAVAGLFGAWVVLALAQARLAELPGRARVRALGIALLVLPSLLTPVSATGQPISVESHVGGLATGMAIGIVIARGLLDPAADR